MLIHAATALRLAALASVLVTAAPALADEPADPPDSAPAQVEAPTAGPEPAPLAADAPAAAPAPVDEAARDSGIRLGLDLGFARAFGGGVDRLNHGSPTLLPIGADLSFRTSRTLLVGLHGHAALASRDDCISADSCRARGYGFGAHVEGMMARGRGWASWIRYGLGYEILYQGGLPLDASGHVYRGAFDILDLRVGADFTVSRGSESKTARIGPFLGLVAGMLVNQTGVAHLGSASGLPRNLDRESGSAHLWFVAGVRATLDP